MVDKYLREPKERVLSSAAFLIPSAVHPIAITLAAFAVGLLAVLAVWQAQYGLGLVLWLVNRLLDGLDGTIARVTRQQSDLGGYLDILLDTVMYAAIPAALALSLGTREALLALLFLLVTFYLNAASWMYLAAILEKRQSGARVRGELTSVTMPSGLLEGTETVLLFTLFLLFPSQAMLLFVLMGVLTIVTLLHRLLWAIRNL